MPYRRKTAPVRRCKPYKRKYVPRNKYRRKTPTTTIIKSPSVVPDRTMVKMRYHDSFTNTSGAIAAVHIFQTSIFDPDLTIAGHQPLGRDQWSSFYNRYRVNGIGFRIIAYNTSNTLQADVAVIAKPNTTTLTLRNQLWETPYSRARVLSPGQSGAGQTTFSGYLAAAKTLGVKGRRYTIDDVYQSVFTANPTTMAYLHIYNIAADGVTASTIRWNVQLTYYVTLFDRHTLTAS